MSEQEKLGPAHVEGTGEPNLMEGSREVLQKKANREALHARVESDHAYHAPTERKVDAHESVRILTEHLAHDLIEIVPAGRELSVALTKLDEVRMWANMGIACAKNDDVSPLRWVMEERPDVEVLPS